MFFSLKIRRFCVSFVSLEPGEAYSLPTEVHLSSICLQKYRIYVRFSPRISTKYKRFSYLWIASQKRIMLDITIYLQRLPILETLLSLRLWHKYQYSEDNNDIWYLIISLVIIIYAGEKTKISLFIFPFVWLYFNRRIYEYGTKVKSFFFW